jgi:hypothetical protein
VLPLSQISKNVIVFLFSSTKLENRRVEQVLPRVGMVPMEGASEVVGKGVGE